MFKDREQRIAVVKTLFGAFNHPTWIDDDGLTAEALDALKSLREGKPTLVIAFPGGPGTRNMVDNPRESRHASAWVRSMDQTSGS